MISLLDPRLWLAFILAILISFVAGNINESRKFEARILKINQSAEETFTEMSEYKDSEISTLNTKLKYITEEHIKGKQNDEKIIERLKRSIADGTYRMSVAVRSCEDRVSSGDSGIAAGTESKKYAELLPETTYDIIRIAQDANEEVRRTNECIDRFNASRESLINLNIKLKELSDK